MSRLYRPMLTGADLLNRVKELGDCAKTDLAKGCGYVVKKKDGSEQVKFTAFYEALLEARACRSPPVDPASAKVAASSPTKLWCRAMAIC